MESSQLLHLSLFLKLRTTRSTNLFSGYKFIFAVSIFVVLVLGNQVHVYPANDETHQGAHTDNNIHQGDHELVQNQKKDSIEYDDVSGNESYADQIMGYCENRNEHCPMISLDVLDKTASRQDVVKTFSDLNLLYDKSKFICHDEGHHLGSWLYNYTKDLKEALNYATLYCGGSNYHGIIQSYFDLEYRVQNVDRNQIKVSQLCPLEQENVNWIHERECIHGIGHGLTILYDYNTTAAVNGCNQFIALWAQSACSRGIFMENVNHFIKTGKGDFDKNEIYSPCDKTVEKFAPQCYFYLPWYLLWGKNYSHNDAYAQCDNISPNKFVKYCYQGIGMTLLFDENINPEQVIKKCYERNQTDYHNDCLLGTMRAMLKQDATTSAAFEICGLSDIDFKSECHKIIGMWIKVFLSPNLQELERECSKTSEIDYVTDCINASEETSVQSRVLEPM